jgi:type VI secretion system secreted protein VgrG
MRRVLAAMIVTLGLGACAPNLPQLTPTSEFTISLTPDTSVKRETPATARPLPARATLPPTWTPTFTPTETDIPTITPTPSITPTLTPIPEEELCAAFEVGHSMNGLRYRAGEKVVFTIYMSIEGAVVDFRAVNAITKDVVKTTLQGTILYTLAFDPVRMPASGRYDWTITVSIDALKDKCAATGFFVVDNTPLEATAEATFEATAEIAPEVTAEATSESTSEATAEITQSATPRSAPTRTRQTPTPVPTPTPRRR